MAGLMSCQDTDDIRVGVPYPSPTGRPFEFPSDPSLHTLDVSVLEGKLRWVVQRERHAITDVDSKTNVVDAVPKP